MKKASGNLLSWVRPLTGFTPQCIMPHQEEAAPGNVIVNTTLHAISCLCWRPWFSNLFSNNTELFLQVPRFFITANFANTNLQWRIVYINISITMPKNKILLQQTYMPPDNGRIFYKTVPNMKNYSVQDFTCLFYKQCNLLLCQFFCSDTQKCVLDASFFVLYSTRNILGSIQPMK